MSGMTDEEIGSYLEEVKKVFNCDISQIIFQRSDGTMALIKFKKEEVGESNDFALLPDGSYQVQVCNNQWKKTQSGGHMLVLTFEITYPDEYAGRKLFTNLNIDCESESAQKIALRDYKAICCAVSAENYYDGIFEVDETNIEEYFASLPENLFGKDIKVTVGIEKSKDPQYPDKNKIKSYAQAEAVKKSWMRK